MATKKKSKKSSSSIIGKIALITGIILGIVTMIIILLVFLGPTPSYKKGFKNLENLVTYSKTTNENVPMDTDNTIKPDFSKYYSTLTPTWKTKISNKLRWIGTLLHIVKPPLWSAGFFKQQIVDLATSREKRGYKDNFVYKLVANPKSKYVIFGNIQGAYHSFIRCLQKIQELGIIDTNLKIKDPDHYIIFMGDIINRSPFTMETLSAVMLLLQTNPDNVIYTRGNHESNNYWQEHTLKTELQLRASGISKEPIPLADEVNKFFNTLPLAAYIAILNNDGAELIRFSYMERAKSKLLNEQNYASFLASKIPGATAISESGAEGDKKEKVSVKVIFEGEKKRKTFQPHDGLRFLPPDMDSVAWTILSCPTVVYQKALKFVHDAFAIITPAAEADEWKITLYNRKVEGSDPFKATTYYLLSGNEESQGKGSSKPKKEKSDAKEEEKDDKTTDKKDEKKTDDEAKEKQESKKNDSVKAESKEESPKKHTSDESKDTPEKEKSKPKETSESTDDQKEKKSDDPKKDNDANKKDTPKEATEETSDKKATSKKKKDNEQKKEAPAKHAEAAVNQSLADTAFTQITPDQPSAQPASDQQQSVSSPQTPAVAQTTQTVSDQTQSSLMMMQQAMLQMANQQTMSLMQNQMMLQQQQLQQMQKSIKHQKKSDKPHPIKKQNSPSATIQDSTTTSTIAQHLEAIDGYVKSIEQHTKAVHDQLQNTQTKQKISSIAITPTDKALYKKPVIQIPPAQGN